MTTYEPTIDNLTDTLRGALGLPRRLVDETARHLREAGMLEAGDAQGSFRPDFVKEVMTDIEARRREPIQ